ncbi:MAG: restriction endonuclease subunit S [Deltaproteobacteria bacterium]|nr:restriction endonuclease subunit S [Deltaproteobacteria bacterium]
MVLNMLFDNYDLLMDSPDSTAKLRELILQLAVQGKLVEQDSTDEPASELLKRIKAEKEKLIAEGRIKKQTPRPPIDPNDVPYELPNGWAWVQLGSLQEFINGYAFHSKDYIDEGVGIVRIGDMQNGQITTVAMKRLPSRYLDELDEKLQIKPGNLLIAMSGATTGKIAFNRTSETFLLNQRVGKINLFLVDYMYTYFFLSTKIKENLRVSAGSAIPNLSSKQINEMFFPLPPFDEQKRIVSKVDQLMHLCDQLDACQEKAATKYESLNDAALEKLLSSKTIDEFANHWQFICNNFDLIYNDPAHVNKLRQAILQLAVQGKLAPQDPNDEPASELLKRIKAEKEKLIKEKKIKRTKPFPPIQPEEVPYDLPDGWEWVRLGEIIQLKSGFTLNKELELSKGDIAYLKVGDMNLPENVKEITLSSRYIKYSDKIHKYIIPSNSIIFPKRGGAIATNKKRIVINNILSDSNTMAMICNKHMDLFYLYQWFMQIDLWQLNSGTSVPQINNKDRASCRNNTDRQSSTT